MNRWLYIRYKEIIDKIIEIGPEVPFTSGSVNDLVEKGHSLSELQKRGSITFTGRAVKTNNKVYKVTHFQFERMQQVREKL